MSHELSFKQLHHGYLGAGLLVVGFLTGYEWFRFIGGYVLLDDLLQHFIQWRWDDTYASPLRFFFNRWLWPLWVKIRGTY